MGNTSSFLGIKFAIDDLFFRKSYHISKRIIILLFNGLDKLGFFIQGQNGDRCLLTFAFVVATCYTACYSFLEKFSTCAITAQGRGNDGGNIP